MTENVIGDPGLYLRKTSGKYYPGFKVSVFCPSSPNEAYRKN